MEYISSKEKVKIGCHEHGIFEQTPCNHLSGKGCPRCHGNPNRTLYYLNQCKEKFGDKFDYTKTEYRNEKKKVIIRCIRHGEMEVFPRWHLKNGCVKCQEEERTQGIISKLREIHHNRYDYSLNGIKTKSKIEIICPKHGKFTQRISHHKLGRGCPKCAAQLISKNKQLSHQDFLSKAEKIHGNRYDYSKVDYKGQKNPIQIICSSHGLFSQMPANHLQGSGCPKCGKENGEEKDCRKIYQFLP